jgi:hypothetical protein
MQWKKKFRNYNENYGMKGSDPDKTITFFFFIFSWIQVHDLYKKDKLKE